MEKEKVYIDEDLKVIIPNFLKNRKNDIENMKNHLEENDLEKIEVIGHGMKGSGGGYGFDYISEIGKRIEKAAKEEDKENIKKSIIKLQEYLENIKIIYR